MIKQTESVVANTPVPDEFKRKPKTISPDPVLWGRLLRAAKARSKAEGRHVPHVRLLDEALRDFLDRFDLEQKG